MSVDVTGGGPNTDRDGFVCELTSAAFLVREKALAGCSETAYPEPRRQLILLPRVTGGLQPLLPSKHYGLQCLLLCVVRAKHRAQSIMPGQHRCGDVEEILPVVSTHL